MFGRKRNKVVAASLDSYQIPRFAFIWLLVAVVSVILPHVARMPFWLTLMCLLCVIGRVLVWQGRMSLPGNKVKLLLVGIMVVLVPVEFGRDIFSTDATVGVLLVGITLKLLEMHQKRDVLLVLYLCYFTVIAEFIYSQSIPVALYMGLVVLLITSALMSLNQTQQTQSPLRTLKLSGSILLQGIPLMLACFLVFPRISPLWSVPLQSASATTGLSDNMSPGDIGNLARSADVAFRVQFAGTAPAQPDLYWRALTLDEFDGRSWRQGFNFEPQLLRSGVDRQQWYQAIDYRGEPIDYNVIMEPSFQNWVYTLMLPGFNDDRMRMRRDYQVDSFRRITQRFSYDARSFPDAVVETGPPGREQRRSLLLPDGNPRAFEFAQSLRTAQPDDAAYVAAVLEHFRTEPFFYTLSPATLGEHPVDDFLFSTQEGFCEHYASSFTFLMRAAGIPARVVTGYQGGEFNPYDGTLVVRQYDAHAWSEVWLPERGWVRIDPTAAVAPDRISLGSDAVLQQQETYLEDEVFTLMRFRNSLLLNDIRFRLEMIDYAWNRFVLNYDQEMQLSLFSRLLGEVTRTKIIALMLGFMTLATLFVALTLFRSRPATRPLPPATAHYLRFCNYLANLGFARRTGETPLNYLERVAATNPQWRAEIETITRAYVELAFESDGDNPDKLKSLRRSVRNFRVLN